MPEIHEILNEIIPSKKPSAEHTLVHESFTDSLEPVYYFVLDLMRELGLDATKLIDTFSPAPGSAPFQELGQRKGIMQQQATQTMASINTVLRSVLNIIYDLKEFRIRIQSYDDLKVKDKDKSEAALLSLKQLWMDKVDIQKGNSSIKGMALGQAGFQTLIDAFLASKDEKAVDKLDLNERVKRILKPRVHEFNQWVTQSEQELKKRYSIEKTYLKSQVSSLKLYVRWAKPYLRAAQQLESKDQGRNPDLVNSFNRTILELTLLGKEEIDPKEAAIAGDLPKEFSGDKFLKLFKRKYYSCVLVDFNFRAVPGQGAHIGTSTITFRAYALNEEEIAKLDEELSKSDLEDAFGLIEGATTESIANLQDDIDFFLKDKSEEEQKEKEKNAEGANPFSALIGGYNQNKKEKEVDKDEKKKGPVKVTKETWIEKEHFRKLAAAGASAKAFLLFDIYKKAHGMASFT